MLQEENDFHISEICYLLSRIIRQQCANDRFTWDKVKL